MGFQTLIISLSVLTFLFWKAYSQDFQTSPVTVSRMVINANCKGPEDFDFKFFDGCKYRSLDLENKRV